jgi:Tfp pilus assembly protein PilN
VSAQTFTSTQTAVAPRVNLLPPEIAERNTLRRAQLGMVGVGLAAVAVVGVMYTQASAKVSSAQRAKADAAAQNVRLNEQLGGLRNVEATYAQVDVANKTIATAMHDDIHWSTYLQDITLTLPENVWLNTMSVKTTSATDAAPSDQVLDPGLGTVTFTGTALSHDDVASWLETVAKERGYSNAYFSQAQEKLINHRVVVDFSGTVNLTDKALSNTYAKGLER